MEPTCQQYETARRLQQHRSETARSGEAEGPRPPAGKEAERQRSRAARQQASGGDRGSQREPRQARNGAPYQRCARGESPRADAVRQQPATPRCDAQAAANGAERRAQAATALESRGCPPSQQTSRGAPNETPSDSRRTRWRASTAERRRQQLDGPRPPQREAQQVRRAGGARTEVGRSKRLDSARETCATARPSRPQDGRAAGRSATTVRDKIR